jgi:hypothetical protein
MVRLRFVYGPFTLRLWSVYASFMVRLRFVYGPFTLRLWSVYASFMVRVMVEDILRHGSTNRNAVFFAPN